MSLERWESLAKKKLSPRASSGVRRISPRRGGHGDSHCGLPSEGRRRKTRPRLTSTPSSHARTPAPHTQTHARTYTYPYSNHARITQYTYTSTRTSTHARAHKRTDIVTRTHSSTHAHTYQKQPFAISHLPPTPPPPLPPPSA